MIDNNHKNLNNIDMSNPFEVRKVLEQLAENGKSKKEITEDTEKSKVNRRNDNSNKEILKNKNMTKKSTNIKSNIPTNPIELTKTLENIVNGKNQREEIIKEKNRNIEQNKKIKRKIVKESGEHIGKEQRFNEKKSRWKDVKDIQKVKPKEKEKFLSLKKTMAIAIIAGIPIGVISGILSYNHLTHNPEFIDEKERFEKVIEEKNRQMEILNFERDSTNYNTITTDMTIEKDYGEREYEN